MSTINELNLLRLEVDRIFCIIVTVPFPFPRAKEFSMNFMAGNMNQNIPSWSAEDLVDLCDNGDRDSLQSRHHTYPTMAALTRATKANYTIHDHIQAETTDREDHTFW